MIVSLLKPQTDGREEICSLYVPPVDMFSNRSLADFGTVQRSPNVTNCVTQVVELSYMPHEESLLLFLAVQKGLF